MVRPWLRIAIFVALAASLVVALFVLRVQDQLGPALEWVDKHRVGGAAVFTAIYALATGAPLALQQDMCIRCSGGKLPHNRKLCWDLS